MPRLVGSLPPHRLLSDDERQRLDRLHGLRYLGVLAARIGCDLDVLGFTAGPFGRPELCRLWKTPACGDDSVTRPHPIVPMGRPPRVRG